MHLKRKKHQNRCNDGDKSMRIYLFLFCLPFVLFATTNNDGCLKCHESHVQNFATSHHALAMQESTEKSVLGNFNNATFNYNGIVSTFFKKNNKFMVTTDNEHGKLQSYEIAYTFGVYPLQQCMIKFPKGKVQVLDIAWDSRAKHEGGERWFHIHEDDNVTAGDVLHWSGPNFNWNFMCADCHSTNLQKNYDPKTKSFHTTYDNITLTCASCHGNGSEHLEWAKNPLGFNGKNRYGLLIDLKKNRWHIDPQSTRPILDGKIDRQEVEMCAQCHSRRAQINNSYHPGEKFDDHYLLSQLDESLYFSNGQIKDEVYEIGSFKQSRMYEAGVSCSDCHDVHTLSRNTLNESVCNKCHQESKYSSQKHHFHSQSGKGASCIACHMPSRTYMGVDERNDHSFSIPRPDLSIGTDNPNACNQCHKNKNAKWANDAMMKWYGKIPLGKQNFSHAMSALHNNSDTAPKLMYDVLMNNQPNIAKATVVAYLGNYPSQQTYTTTLQMLHNSDSDIRLSALRALEAFPLKLRVQKTLEMLDDNSKIIRMEAAHQLSALAKEDLNATSKAKLSKALDEYEASLLYNADRAESQSALGSLYVNLGMLDKARKAFDEALRLQPKYTPAIINAAQFYQNSNDAKTKEILEHGIKLLPNEAALHHALGLWYVRHHDANKALELLKHAAVLEPKNARFQYVYAVALAPENASEAIRILESSLALHSGDTQTLYALAFYSKQIGLSKKAKMYQTKADSLSNFIYSH